MKKIPNRSKPLDASILPDLPRFSFTREAPRTRDQAERKDVAFEIRSLDELFTEASRRFRSLKG